MGVLNKLPAGGGKSRGPVGRGLGDHPILTLVLSTDNQIGVPGLHLPVWALTTWRIAIIRRYLISNLQFSDSKRQMHLIIPLEFVTSGESNNSKFYTKTIVVTLWYTYCLACNICRTLRMSNYCFQMTP